VTKFAALTSEGCHIVGVNKEHPKSDPLPLHGTHHCRHCVVKIRVVSVIMGKVCVIWRFKMGSNFNLHTDWVKLHQERDFYLG
jgi:hypothetical protein